MPASASCSADHDTQAMKIKPGVLLDKLTPSMAVACVVVESVYRRGGYDATITSGSDGKHTGQPLKGDTVDPHYSGRALDFRISDVKSSELPDLVQALRTCLGDEFAVLQEDTHLHIQAGYVA